MATIKNGFWHNKKVLITGSGGFKGSWLTLLLNRLGAKIWGYSLNPETKPSLNELLNLNKSNFHRNLVSLNGDINDEEKFYNFIKEFEPEIIFHLAAQPLVKDSYINPINTWQTNLIGSLKVLEGIKKLDKFCTVIMISTDKVYKNNEWLYGYRETDELGGDDPYSASKAAMEIAISSWRKSFCGNGKHQTNKLLIASARSGNVIGGGDWSKDRVIPDYIRAINQKKVLKIRSPLSTRPWQHVLDPLYGYILLAEKLYLSKEKKDQKNNYEGPFNFGPSIDSNKTVEELIKTAQTFWHADYSIRSDSSGLKESNLLNLSSEKSQKILLWHPKWDFQMAVKKTIRWYEKFYKKNDVLQCCLDDIDEYLG